MGHRAFTIKQAQKLDRLAIEQCGIPSFVLMENAGRLTAEHIIKTLRKPKGHFICIFCGPGNNGGDGLVVARYLLNAGYQTKVFLMASPAKLKNDSFANYQIFKKLKGSVKSIKGLDKEVARSIKDSTLIVDAIFGIGLTRIIENLFEDIIKAIGQSRKKVIAVDVPSGLNATTGEVFGTCIKASETVTFAVMKKGFLIKKGPLHCGQINVVDIGIPKALERKLTK